MRRQFILFLISIALATNCSTQKETRDLVESITGKPAVITSEKQESLCPICYAEKSACTLACCKQKICAACKSTLSEKNATCPYCRKEISYEEKDFICPKCKKGFDSAVALGAHRIYSCRLR